MSKADSYLLGDHLGSASIVINEAGDVVSSRKYYPYGRAREVVEAMPTDKQFTGHQLEPSGLYFMQARFYDPMVGRFLAPDSIVPDLANPQALNRYSYVYNNPLRYTDPDGHCPVCSAVGSGIASGAGAVGSTLGAGAGAIADGGTGLAVNLKDETVGVVSACVRDCAGTLESLGSAIAESKPVEVAALAGEFVAGVGVDCWQSDTCRAITVSIGVVACSMATEGWGAAGCVAAGAALLSYEDAIDCLGGDKGGCVSAGTTAAVAAVSGGAGRGVMPALGRLANTETRLVGRWWFKLSMDVDDHMFKVWKFEKQLYHIQLNLFKRGIKGSHKPFRLPITKRFYERWRW